jgi:hypothetical protein
MQTCPNHGFQTPGGRLDKLKLPLLEVLGPVKHVASHLVQVLEQRFHLCRRALTLQAVEEILISSPIGSIYRPFRYEVEATARSNQSGECADVVLTAVLPKGLQQSLGTHNADDPPRCLLPVTSNRMGSSHVEMRVQAIEGDKR